MVKQLRGVTRTGEREVRIAGPDPLAIFRSFAAAVLLTRDVSLQT